MKNLIQLAVLVFCCWVGILTLGQGVLVDTYAFAESSVTIDLPAKGDLTETDDGHIEFVIEGIAMSVYDHVALETAFDFTEADSVDDAMNTLAPELLADSDDFDEDAVTTDTLDDDREFAWLDVEGDETVSIIVLMMSDGSFGVLQVVTGNRQVASTKSILLDILETFDSRESGGLSLDIDTTALSDAFCNVSTSQANTVQVRVGPGTNRTVVSFLPANVEFVALGKAEADDGSLWFKVDKDEAAPGKAVNETWILAESVIHDGNCDAVADVAAPPIIPIIAQPTPKPDGSPPDESDYILPQGGTWTLSWGAIFLSCSNGASGSVDSGLTPLPVFVTGGGPNGLSIQNEIYASSGVNNYTLSDVFVMDGDSINATVTMRVNSETSISGRISFGVDNCTGTLPVTISR